MRQSVTPSEFLSLAGRISYVRQVSSTEWCSSCPNCGGNPHQNGDFPDRFRMFTNAHGKNKVMGWCRRCSYVWLPNKEHAPSPEEFEKWRKEQIEREEQRKREAEQAIALLKSQKIWEHYQTQINAWGWEVIESWGITKEYADFWKLGMIPDYTVWSSGESYHSPAISIPVWNYGWDVKNVKVRVLNPKSSHDRYRSLYKVGADFPFVAWPELTSDECIVVEGEKKAMVVAEFADHKLQVVGVPSKTPSPECLKILEKFGKINLCLDPDASEEDKKGNSPLKRMVHLLGKERTAVMELPGKVDDLIVYHKLDIVDALRYARIWR